MCVDYDDLQKACPKNFYLLPQIDQLIDATSWRVMLIFMDVFSGYHQIAMKFEHIPKTAFIIYRAIYAYQMMTFGMINVGATYQQMMNMVFTNQTRKTVEVYLDDMIVKSMEVRNHPNDLEGCFPMIQEHNMQLNPTKYTFTSDRVNFWVI